MGQAEQDQLRAWELDPFNPEIVAHVGALYSHLGRADEAIAEGLKTLEMAPEFPLGYAFLADSYGRKGMYDEAIAAAKKAGELSPRLRWYLGRVYAAAGRKEEARAVLAELSQAKPSPFGALGRAQVCIALGDMDEAFRWLNYEPHHAWVPWTTVLWGADALRKDPRFPELRRRWNLPPQPASASP
jgi:tetratricopeptide (TPR) repeat protein